MTLGLILGRVFFYEIHILFDRDFFKNELIFWGIGG